MSLNCLVVDDEPLARKGMMEYIRETEFLNLAGESSNAAEAEVALAKGGIDLLLLDVQMPGLSGLDFLRTLSSPPMVIITTAFTEYALEGYELAVMDYLVKPIPYDRFLKAVNKAHDFHQLKHKEEKTSSEFCFVKSQGKFEKVHYADIQFVEAMQNYIIVHLPGQKLIVYKTLTGMEEELPKARFMRVHKSFIAAIDKVKAIDDHDLIIGVHRVPVSRNLIGEVRKLVMGNNLLQR
jgi:DNA-binding LytR/AlgR family response regulator